MTYDDFVRGGYLKTFSVRLPITTIAKLRELHKRDRKSWPAIQALVFDLLEDSIERWTKDGSDPAIAHELQKVATRALQLRASGFDRPDATEEIAG